MKKNKNLTIILLITICFFFCNKNKTKNSETRDFIASRELLSVSEDIKEIYKNESDSLHNIIVQDYNGDKNKLISFIGNHSKLVFWFPNFGCQSCLDEELFFLKDALKKISDNDIVVISKFDNLKGLKLFKISNDFKCKCLNTQQDSLGASFEKMNRPCIFLLDSTMKVNCFFIPKRNYPELTMYYYKTIIQRFYNKNEFKI
jgi:hypothetical protein